MNAQRLLAHAGPDVRLRRVGTHHDPAHVPGGERWAARSRAVLKEATQATSLVSNRRWTVVHPAHTSMHTLLAQLELDGAPHHEIETPNMIHWRSKLDGELYTLVEFFQLSRQPGLARPISGSASGSTGPATSSRAGSTATGG